MSENKASLGSLIPMIGELQDILSTLPKDCKIDIPQIVVLGDQSVGKSSTLEAIVGKDFLPRGEGMVTKCPILLHLVPVPEDDSRRKDFQEEIRSQDWAIFKDDQGKDSKVFTDFEEVRKEIKERTDKICGNGVSEKVISLKIFSSKVIELTLVDLPGITTVAARIQNEEVPEEIEKLVMTYIKNPKSIILIVTQATQDFITSVSLKHAEKVDKDHERTLCVLTKLDEATNINKVKNILTGEMLNFKHGIIGVVNRSENDTTKSIEDCLKDEQKFLKKNFDGMASTNGVYFLREKLNKLLDKHIRDCLPKFREEFDKEIAVKKELYERCGWPITEENKHRIIGDSINDFCNTYESRLWGTASEVNKRSTGAEIKKLFESFCKELDDINPSEQINNFETSLLYSITNARGAKSSVFLPEESFEHFSTQYLSFFTAPSHKCAKQIFDLLKTMGNEMQKKTERFPEFEKYISSAYNHYLEHSLGATIQSINYLIKIQNSSFNAQCISIFEEEKSDESIKKCTQTAATKGFTEQETITANFTKRALQTHFNHVRKILQDVIPKAILTSLILHVKENFKKDFITNSEGVLDKCFAEDESITRCRAETEETLKKLYESRDKLS